jgi:flagellar basal-body rod protein FlgG
MMRALYTAATGMIAEQTNVDTIANNLANVNTNGYKTERTEFKSLLYQTLQTKTTTANGEQKPVGAQVGLGTRVAATNSIYTQGSMLASESNTDFCIEGDGFFCRERGGRTDLLYAQRQLLLVADGGWPYDFGGRFRQSGSGYQGE